MRLIQYIGSKSQSIEEIDRICSDKFGENSTVMDLYSGSGACSVYFMSKRRVISNDIQKYSYLICKDILETPTSNSDLDFPSIFARYLAEKEAMESMFDSEIRAEEEFLNAPGESSSLRALSTRRIDSNDGTSQNWLVLAVGGDYFSYRQACELQSLINVSRQEPYSIRDQMTAGIIFAASALTSSVGNQFAQPLKMIDNNGKLKEASVHKKQLSSKKNAWEAFISYYYENKTPKRFSCNNVSLCGTDTDALDAYIQETDFVYADPPYGREHYSRFYNLLECIARDDAMLDTSLRNPMRADRFQSPFCIRSMAKDAFSSILIRCRTAGKPIAISYADDSAGSAVKNRVLTSAALQEIVQIYFDKVEIYHLGRKRYASLNNTSLSHNGRATREILIIGNMSQG